MNRPGLRAGYTLIEVMVVASVGSMLMLLAIAWIGETMKFASRTTDHLRQHQQLTQLARNFRNDVRLSHSLKMDGEQRLVLQGESDLRIIYSFSGTTIESERNSGSQVSRERYPLEAGSLIEWDTSGMPDSIGLVVSRSQDFARASKPDSVAESAGLADRTNNLVESEAFPIDIHIFAQVKRWEFGSFTENMNGGGQ